MEPVRRALRAGWQVALTKDAELTAKRDSGAYESPQKPEYWDRPVKKLRRMESEATPSSA